jgi:hypothetical protein
VLTLYKIKCFCSYSSSVKIENILNARGKYYTEKAF